MFDNHRFLVDAEMEGGCTPLLTVRFLPSSSGSRMLWDGAPVRSALVESSSGPNGGQGRRGEGLI